MGKIYVNEHAYEATHVGDESLTTLRRYYNEIFRKQKKKIYKDSSEHI